MAHPVLPACTAGENVPDLELAAGVQGKLWLRVVGLQLQLQLQLALASLCQLLS